MPAASTIKPEEREFAVDSGAGMHIVSKKDLNSAELHHEDIEESDDGDDGQRQGANKRRSHGVCQRIGFIRDRDASCRSSFTRDALRRTWVYLSLDQWSKTTSHQKWQKNQLQYSELRTICCPGLSTRSSTTTTPTSSSSSSQDSVFDESRYTEHPVPERSGSTSEELRRNPMRKPTETEKLK